MLTAYNPIRTVDKVISVKGKVLYNDGKRRIELKRPIRDLFEGSSADVFYMMEFHLSKEKAVQRLNELAEKQVMPVILYFCRGDIDEN